MPSVIAPAPGRIKIACRFTLRCVNRLGMNLDEVGLDTLKGVGKQVERNSAAGQRLEGGALSRRSSRRLRVALVTGSYNFIADGVALTLNRLVTYLEGVGVEVL